MQDPRVQRDEHGTVEYGMNTDRRARLSCHSISHLAGQQAQAAKRALSKRNPQLGLGTSGVPLLHHSWTASEQGTMRGICFPKGSKTLCVDLRVQCVALWRERTILAKGNKPKKRVNGSYYIDE